MKFIIFLLLIPVIWANKVVAPTIHEQKDFGIISYEEFLYSASVDCTAGTIKVVVMDEEFNRVRDASTYLRYIDFAQPLISTVKTDKDGVALHKLPGKVELMTGFFILVIQKNEFRNKEIHFDIAGCFSDGPVVQPKPPGWKPEEEPEEIEEINETEIPEIEENRTEIPKEEPAEETGEEAEEEPVCAGGLILPLIMLYKMKGLQSQL